MHWSAQQYRQFEEARNRPIVDLLARLPDDGIHRAIDIGCGPGNSTQLLQEKYPQALVHGIDSSADMVASARKRLPGIDFRQSDIAGWQAEPPCDVILANAVLQWLPEHAALFPHLLAQLAPGGYLAVQMPDNLDEPAHVAMREVAAQPRWAAQLADVGALRAPRHAPAWYAQQLDTVAQPMDIWRTTYHHRLAQGVDGVIEWFKGSALRPYLQRLSDDEGSAFLDDYRHAIRDAYPLLDDGSLLLPFPRLFLLLRAPTSDKAPHRD